MTGQLAGALRAGAKLHENAPVSVYSCLDFLANPRYSYLASGELYDRIEDLASLRLPFLRDILADYCLRSNRSAALLERYRS